jgi:hypothetical protein
MEAGQLEQVVDHRREALRLGPHLLVVARRVGGQAVLEGLRHRAQPGQRGAQVMRDPGHQLPPGLLKRALPGARTRQLRAGVRQFRGQGRELRGQRPHRGPELARLVAERPGSLPQRRAAGRDLPPEQPAETGRHDAGDDAHHHDDAEIMPGQEHRLGGAERAGHDRERGHDAARLDGQAERGPPQQPDDARARQPHGARAARRDQEDLELVTHDGLASQR